jgi:hypothetical protein
MSKIQGILGYVSRSLDNFKAVLEEGDPNAGGSWEFYDKDMLDYLEGRDR